jgi:hypothetical protein
MKCSRITYTLQTLGTLIRTCDVIFYLFNMHFTIYSDFCIMQDECFESGTNHRCFSGSTQLGLMVIFFGVVL